MSVPISTVVTVTITKTTRVVSLPSFSVPLILGPSARFGDLYRDYTDPTEMVADGFLPSDPEYIHAVALSSQLIRPATWVVGHFTAAVAQVDTLMVGTLASGHLYQFTLNSIIISYTSSGGDTQQSILAALLTAIGVAYPTNPPVTGAVTGSGAGATLTLTSSVAGVGFSITAVDADLTLAHLTPNHSIVNDLQTLQAGILPADQFYGVLVTSKAASDVLQVATYIETQLLVYIFASLDAGILVPSTTTDIFSQLKALSFERTWGIYSAGANTQATDAAWMGYMIPTTPGIGQWGLKTLKGVTADNLSPTQFSSVLAKNGNAYVTMGSSGVTYPGVNFFGEFVDLEILVDWTQTNIQIGIFNVLTDPNNLKVPYDNSGINMIENPVRAVLSQGQANQGYLPGWDVFAPDEADVSTADKADRTLNNLGFDAKFAGAIIKVNLKGNVSV